MGAARRAGPPTVATGAWIGPRAVAPRLGVASPHPAEGSARGALPVASRSEPPLTAAAPPGGPDGAAVGAGATGRAAAGAPQALPFTAALR